MENKIFSKLNLYDQIGYVLVGAIALLLATLDVWLLKSSTPKLNGSNLIIWFIIAYFTGHIVQAIANIFIKEEKENFSESDRRILNEARKFFDLKKEPDSTIYSLCYMLTLAKDLTGHVQLFNAYYSLYRGWFITIMLQLIFLVYYFGASFYDLKALFLIISFILVAILFRRRSIRFYRYSREKTLQTFLIIKRLNL